MIKNGTCKRTKTHSPQIHSSLQRLSHTQAPTSRVEALVIGLPIIREVSGLALSSRNKLIPKKKIKIAENIYICLQQISKEIIFNGLEIKKLESYKNNLLKLGVEEVNYLEILKETNLEVLDQKPSIARIFISVNLFGVKLIDNFRVPKKLVQKDGLILGLKD